jgi:AraC family transcriptional regulator
MIGSREVQQIISRDRATPDEWAGQLSAPADLSSERSGWSTALMRHWTGGQPDLDQPALDHHYIVQHLGGPKKVDRRRDGASVSAVVESGSLSIVPVGTHFKWHTQGPIEFAHLYLAPSLLSRMALRFEKLSDFSLVDRVGCRDPLLEASYSAMLNEIRTKDAVEPLYMDSLLETFVIKLLREHSTARNLRSSKPREMLAAYQLKRVMEFVEARLGSNVALSDLANVAGGSVFHFSRAFRNTAGDTPYRYVLRRRIERAKHLLVSSDTPIAEVARTCGFSSHANFAKTFSRFVGTTPKRFRQR